jgi:hypothetical protein
LSCVVVCATAGAAAQAKPRASAHAAMVIFMGVSPPCY